ncbi:hypothetical protein CDAR_539101 [Caerostris darwini]|uniref:Uncharacterized protein n=1 Tax=Caerostris darwini TaxID=1538125 RepID=A0AAV4T0D2_9ARAC|nr:hypothetical protein CDAR_539101 [Caerostris darwini]
MEKKKEQYGALWRKRIKDSSTSYSLFNEMQNILQFEYESFYVDVVLYLFFSLSISSRSENDFLNGSHEFCLFLQEMLCGFVKNNKKKEQSHISKMAHLKAFHRSLGFTFKKTAGKQSMGNNLKCC